MNSTAIVLSNRLFPLVQFFINQGRSYYMNIEEAQTFDQRPFRSALIRQYLMFRSGHGFYLTAAGRDAWERFRHTDIHRINALAPLTRFFDPVAHGVRIDERKLAIVKKKRRAAAA
jgi:hypothetical protein